MNYYGIFDSSWVLEIFLFVPRPRHDKKKILSLNSVISNLRVRFSQEHVPILPDLDAALVFGIEATYLGTI